MVRPFVFPACFTQLHCLRKRAGVSPEHHQRKDDLPFSPHLSFFFSGMPLEAEKCPVENEPLFIGQATMVPEVAGTVPRFRTTYELAGTGVRNKPSRVRGAPAQRAAWLLLFCFDRHRQTVLRDRCGLRLLRAFAGRDVSAGMALESTETSTTTIPDYCANMALELMYCAKINQTLSSRNPQKLGYKNRPGLSLCKSWLNATYSPITRPRLCARFDMLIRTRMHSKDLRS